MNNEIHSNTLRDLTRDFLSISKNNVLLCEGIDDGFYSTISSLSSEFSTQCYEIPCSENSMIGLALSASSYEITTIVCLQRVEFALLAIEQFINNAAKNTFLTNGSYKNPCLFRFVIGRGWGQGPSHSQSFETIFSQIPDINVFMPVFPHDSELIFKNFPLYKSPTICLEHRWVHYSFDTPSSRKNSEPTSYCLNKGNDLTVVGYSYNVLIANIVAGVFASHNIDIEIINLLCLSNINYKLIADSINKTNALLLLDLDDRRFSVSSEIISQLSLQGSLSSLIKKPFRLANKGIYSPASPTLAKEYYLNANDIAKKIVDILDINEMVALSIFNELDAIDSEFPSDIPNRTFSGPF